MCGVEICNVKSNGLLRSSTKNVLYSIERPWFYYVFRNRYVSKTFTYDSCVFSALLFGCIVLAVAILLKRIDNTLFNISLTVGSVIIGPRGALFFLALLMPWVDWIVRIFMC